MLKNAARIWGYKDTELETAYDPLVGLLMGALSVELEKVSDEIESSQARILDRLAQLLTPDVLTASRPSHAIVHARPSEPELMLNKEQQLYTSRKVTSNISSAREQTKDIFFSSAMPVKLLHGDIRYMAAGNTVYQFINSFQKEMAFEAVRGQSLDTLTLWLGISLNERVKNLGDSALFFDIRNESEKDAFLQNLVLAKFYLNDKEVTTTPGLIGSRNSQRKNNIHQELDITPKVENYVREFYNNQFITLSDRDGLLENEKINRMKFPREFNGIFSDKDLQKIQEELIWIKVVFPSSMKHEVLGDVNCSMNAFPVINRRLHKFSYRLQDNLNIIPLNAEDIFFDLRIVYSSDGTIFQSKPLTNYNKLEGGTYALRHGGVARFDSRSASELISHLTDLLRDESAAFSVLGNEFLSSDIRQLNQVIASLEQKSGKVTHSKETVSYLMIRSRGQQENIFIEFWTLNGLLANNLRAGHKLDVYSGGDLDNDSILLLTATSGGLEKLSSTDSLNAYKEAVLTRGRVVTMQDIKSVCLHELGALVSDVEVRKGVMVDSHTRNGIRRVIEIILHPIPKQDIPVEDWTRYARGLEVTLAEKSTGMYPFKVMVQDN